MAYAIPQDMMNSDFSCFSELISTFNSPFDIVIPNEFFGDYLNTDIGSKLKGSRYFREFA